jgi:7-cyano-7-deazaguanine reductase
VDVFESRTDRYYDIMGSEKVDFEVLATIPYEGNQQMVEYVSREFSAVCPFSGLPDLAQVYVSYVPGATIVELKSLKYYFVSYRNVGMYQEEITHRIYSDLKKLLSPKFLKIKTIYGTRGGIDATCVMDSRHADS